MTGVLIDLIIVCICSWVWVRHVRNRKWRPFLLCLPVSALVYLITKIVLTMFTAEGVQLPDIALFVAVSFIQAPFLMLGTYWARRKQKRNNYEV
jgi:hypothetical protein